MSMFTWILIFIFQLPNWINDKLNYRTIHNLGAPYYTDGCHSSPDFAAYFFSIIAGVIVICVTGGIIALIQESKEDKN